MLPLRHIRPSARTTIASVVFAALAAGSAAGAFAAKPSNTGGHGSTDTTVPTVVMSTPAPGATVANTVTVNGTASDNSSLANVAVSVDGGAWQTASGTSSWSWSWNTNAVANGSHTVTARATDAAGNRSTDSATVTVSNSTTTADATSPSISISKPTAGASVAGTVSVAGTASDNVSLANVTVQVDGGAWQTASGTSSWSWSWNSAAVANGTHTLTARATDASGNWKTTSVSVTVSNSSGSTGSAPNTQGSWTSPEGVKINVNSSGPWTINQIYSILTANAYELSLIGPHLTINVQDTTASQTSTSGSGSTFQAVMYLKGVSSTFASHPDSQETHEYGHAWSLYHLYTQNGGSWTRYLNARWSSSDGSVTLASDSRTGTSYTWNPSEILADDYRLLFGTAAAQSLNHLNAYIVDPRQQAGLKSWLINHFATGT